MQVDVTNALDIARRIGEISTTRAQADDAWNEVDSLISILETLLEPKEVKPDLGSHVDADGWLRFPDDPFRDFDNLRLRAVLDAMRESSWDWPSAMFALGGLDSDDEPTMYPGDREIAWLKSIAPEENWEGFDTSWDT